ncbi:MAG: putative orf [Candidatus Scalindua rubra]|uniref:Putative orf n=1 Tax=Candidatus Scalindua rubra TaxID=1872076 RepID=A0A1E3XCV5_9BACT|nr:MAG: putative orf [Candidatus Scalindua rubra]
MSLIGQVITLYEIVLFVRIILSWIPHNPHHPAAAFLYKITEPVLQPVRRIIPSIGGIDVSPIIVFIALGFIRRLFH